MIYVEPICLYLRRQSNSSANKSNIDKYKVIIYRKKRQNFSQLMNFDSSTEKNKSNIYHFIIKLKKACRL